MTTTDFDRSTLSWVRRELDNTLQEAARALEAYAGDRADETQLRFCATYVHQVYGTLQMLELHGAAMLAEELEQLVEALLAGSTTSREDAEEVLMTGILRCARLLEEIEQGQVDSTLQVLDYVNNLRSCRDEPPLEAGALFSPDLSSLRANLPDRDRRAGESIVALAGRYRGLYQRALLLFLRGRQEERGLEKLAEVLDALDAASGDGGTAGIWWIAAGVVEGLRHQALENSRAIKTLLGQVDRELKRVIDHGPDTWVEDVPEDLLKSLLHQVAVTPRPTQRLREIRRCFGLEASESDTDDGEKRHHPGPGADILDSVTSAMREDVTLVKDALDLYVRTGQVDARRLRDAADNLDRVADTLGMLGMGGPRSVVKEHLAVLHRLADGEDVTEHDVMELARTLLYVDSCLDSVRQEGVAPASLPDGTDEERQFDLEYRAVYQNAIREAVADIATVKDTIVQHIERDNQEPLASLDTVMHRLKGALEMVDLRRAASLIGAMREYLRREVVDSGAVPEADELDCLADAITSLEYYLEAVMERRGGREAILDVAERSLERLAASPAGSEAPGDAETARPQSEPSQAADSNAARPAGIPETPARPGGHAAGVNLDVPVRGEELDPDILDIFLEEVDEVLETISANLPRLRADPDDAEALATLRRMWHTLKGSGRLAGALLLGELAWSVERLFNRVIERKVPVEPSLHQLVDEAVVGVRALAAELRGNAGGMEEPAIRALIRRAQCLADGLETPESETPESETPESEATESEATESEATESEATESETAESETAESETAESETAESETAPTGTPLIDPVLYDIFRAETLDHLASVRGFIEGCRNQGDSCAVSDALGRALHTLAGSARMANVTDIALLARGLEQFVERRREQGRRVDVADNALLEDGVNRIGELLDALGDADLPMPPIDELMERLQEFTGTGWRPGPANSPVTTGATATAPAPLEGTPLHDADPELVGLFLEEAEDILRLLDESVERWDRGAKPADPIAELQRSLHTLKGGARLAGFDHFAELCHGLETLTVRVERSTIPADDVFFDLLASSLDSLHRMVLAARSGAVPEAAEPVLESIRERIADAAGTGGDAPEETHDGTDPELVEVFLEESAEVLHSIEVSQQAWAQDPDNEGLLRDIQRALHTLKGGARMAGYAVIADLAHAVETLLNRVRDGAAGADQALFELLERCHDQLHSMREAAASGQSPLAATSLCDEIAERRGDVVPEESAPPADIPPSLPERAVELPRPAGATDLVRVRAEMLDNLVNHAGEVSIYRARLDQQVGAFRFNLAELDQTVGRLREQLRALEIETESQILHRFERHPASPDHEDGEGFDPLELDRFSRMQELSRALVESVNDLGSIETMLDGLAREAETLLLQQSRVNTELQEGLMRTRMVPFANLAPRLRRIVRQTAQELGKQVQVRVLGGQGEMDRNVLERVTAPLEHMLRNAVAHGIEVPDRRWAAGKPETGQIVVSLDREGSEVVLRVADDGGGMDLEAIRSKAIARGLIRGDAALTDREIMQFVLEQGFSTAESVTQIAGRGVGMDVVNAEIKQLGGTLDIDSQQGRGSTFTVRLPFTLAMNQALLCTAAEQAYAIPLTAIDGVVRLTREQLEAYFRNAGDAEYHYAGQDYQVRALAELLGTGEAGLSGSARRVPVILIQTGDHRLALQVDGLLGAREIVVKSVGPQISSVPGIFGATILADGRVVFILDMGAMVRLGAAPPSEDTTPVDPEPVLPDENPTVMVVDDSITMRKVATRLLERNGMSVVTAKDGVDAVALLQEHVPDVMLLDIEMPRMDGYELATHMRNDPALREIPIIMITSRTGEKHRKRALDIGVSRYLGKPYQETELMDNLREVIEARHGIRRQ